jgi:hypothetical protein
MDSHDLILPAQIYALGDKYFIASLKKKAREKFQVCARTVFARKCFYDAVQIVVHLNAGYGRWTAGPGGAACSGELDDALRNVPDLAYWVMSYEDAQRLGETERGPLAYR